MIKQKEQKATHDIRNVLAKELILTLKLFLTVPHIISTDHKTYIKGLVISEIGSICENTETITADLKRNFVIEEELFSG